MGELALWGGASVAPFLEGMVVAGEWDFGLRCLNSRFGRRAMEMRVTGRREKEQSFDVDRNKRSVRPELCYAAGVAAVIRAMTRRSSIRIQKARIVQMDIMKL